ncbi:pol protein [Cucumis melo var. makuwa]|uniref:Pol protein n=1 Tax=Cucumis melo var. makuwa TaxID=1194695 RepID=A0A5A7SNS7_CUCMM|nr:pol protein [Cucumis melo var. makuwa]
MGPELVQFTNEAIQKIRSRMQTAQSRQKRYADVRQKDLEFDVGDKVFLKVAPMEVYRLALPPSLSAVHDVFHVSMLRKYVSDPSHVVDHEPLEIDENLSYTEQPVEVLAREVKMLRNREIPLVKVLWRNHRVEEATWEREDDMSRLCSPSAPGQPPTESLNRSSDRPQPTPSPFLFVSATSDGFSLLIPCTRRSPEHRGELLTSPSTSLIQLLSSGAKNRIRKLTLKFSGSAARLIGDSSSLLEWIRWTWTRSRGITKCQVARPLVVACVPSFVKSCLRIDTDARMITRLICASFGITRLICASFEITRLIDKDTARGRLMRDKKDA